MKKEKKSIHKRIFNSFVHSIRIVSFIPSHHVLYHEENTSVINVYSSCFSSIPLKHTFHHVSQADSLTDRYNSLPFTRRGILILLLLIILIVIVIVIAFLLLRGKVEFEAEKLFDVSQKLNPENISEKDCKY